MSTNLYKDIDSIETEEWIQSIDAVIQSSGIERATFLAKKILSKINNNENITKLIFRKSDYINTIPKEKELKYPGEIEIENRICSAIRWNAAMIVLRASKKNLDLGGHIASFQSIADIYEVCFNHFFKSEKNRENGDLIYFQGHTSPGIYARAFLEGRLTENQMNNFRQETFGNGLSSYPHPKLMPEFWQFPTVSMGLGAINAIYQAKFLRYLYHRGLKDTSNQKVYCFLGDGEMDEPESKGAINIASREKLDNLIFIINCNLQRLDGPVMGNGKIIDELENIFYGSGWKVIKVIWGGKWDKLFEKDTTGKLTLLMNETVDGDYQTFRSKDGAYIRKFFFEKYPETKLLVKDMSDEDIWKLNHGGHDFKKIYSAIKEATETIDQPTVILFHTIKGYGMGLSAEGMNIAHQVKNMDIKEIKNFRDRFNINIKDEEIESLPYISFEKGTKEYEYLHKRRKILNGYIPKRSIDSSDLLQIPNIEEFSSLLNEQKKETSTTVTIVRILGILLRNKLIKDRIVPIVADEARTFGMDSLFQQIGIYNSMGQKYIPQDKNQFTFYREDKNGQILQEGINELGAASSWLAAATSYSNNNFTMIPFYIYYSMFGFQRIGDLLWAAGDQQARGFLIGGTSGRTTLNGEGLQHADGHSHIHALTVPNCISYDPTYAYEIVTIIHNGLKRMYENRENIYYYLTVLNENYYMPSMPHGSEYGICKGIYKFKTFSGNKCTIQLIGSGAILQNIIKAANILSQEYNIGSDVYSATSFTELARDGQDCERWNMLHPTQQPKIPYVTTILKNFPTIVATDYMRIFAEQIRNFVPSKEFIVLGTDGFGRSDSRTNLRNYFEISEKYIVVASLFQLSKTKKFSYFEVENAIRRFNIDSEKVNPRLM